MRSSATKVGPFRFDSDGWVERRTLFGTITHPASPFAAYSCSDGTRNKATVGRAVGAVMTGGFSLVLTPGTTGQLTVVIATQDWAATWTAPPSMRGMYARLVEQCMLAEVRVR